jgi:hypothetical protein
MEVYLTEEELKREEALFKPHKEVYKPLDGKRKYGIKEFVPVESNDTDKPKPPPSC